jgi:hypothetical protein
LDHTEWANLMQTKQKVFDPRSVRNVEPLKVERTTSFTLFLKSWAIRKIRKKQTVIF